jgi:hypothetical protein
VCVGLEDGQRPSPNVYHIIIKMHGIVNTIPDTVGVNGTAVKDEEHPACRACQRTMAIMTGLFVAAHKDNKTSHSQPLSYPTYVLLHR